MSDRYKVGDYIDVRYEDHHEEGKIVELGEVWIGNVRFETALLRRDIEVWVNLTKALSIRLES